MRPESKVINFKQASSFRLDPTLTSEEAIVLRALGAGRTDRQVCSDLRMAPETFLRMMRDVREKTSSASNLTLREWAQQQIKGVERRMDDRENLGRRA